jgi:putative tricarboxylic transport membrane protein
MWLTLGIGIVGYLLEKVRVPLSPMLLGIVLGALAEKNLRRSLIISHDDPLIFIQRPVSGVLILMAVLALVAMWRANKRTVQ